MDESVTVTRSERLGVRLGLALAKLHVLSSGGTVGDVFCVHGDKMVYDDCDHGKDTEGVGEGVQSIMGDHSRSCGR
jgi:hypothetical protein